MAHPISAVSSAPAHLPGAASVPQSYSKCRMRSLPAVSASIPSSAARGSPRSHCATVAATARSSSPKSAEYLREEFEPRVGQSIKKIVIEAARGSGDVCERPDAATNQPKIFESQSSPAAGSTRTLACCSQKAAATSQSSSRTDGPEKNLTGGQEAGARRRPWHALSDGCDRLIVSAGARIDGLLRRTGAAVETEVDPGLGGREHQLPPGVSGRERPAEVPDNSPAIDHQPARIDELGGQNPITIMMLVD